MEYRSIADGSISYAGFDVNMVSRSGSHVVPVYVPDGEKAIAPESLAAFEDALQACKDEGREVKAVVSVPWIRLHSDAHLLASCYAILKIPSGGHTPLKHFLLTRRSQRSTISTLLVMKFMR